MKIEAKIDFYRRQREENARQIRHYINRQRFVFAVMGIMSAVVFILHHFADGFVWYMTLISVPIFFMILASNRSAILVLKSIDSYYKHRIENHGGDM